MKRLEPRQRQHQALQSFRKSFGTNQVYNTKTKSGNAYSSDRVWCEWGAMTSDIRAERLRMSLTAVLLPRNYSIFGKRIRTSKH